MEEVHEDIIIITSLFYFNNNKLIKNHFNFGGGGGVKKFSYHNLKSYIQRGYGLGNLLWGYGDPLPLTTKL